MAVDVSKIPNNSKFDPVRVAILNLQGQIEDTGATIGNGTLTINTSGALTGNGTFTANQTGPSTITIGLDDSSYLTEEVNDLTAAVTWANVPDANITQSSVTQHQAALSITESQISDLGNYLDLDDTGEQTIAGDIVISGDLTVSGTTTFIDTTNLNIGDNIITLNADLPSGTAPTENAGIEINRGSATNVSFLWDEVADKWTFLNQNVVANTFEGDLTGTATNANYATSAGNADTLDTYHANEFTLDYVTSIPAGNTTSNDISVGNLSAGTGTFSGALQVDDKITITGTTNNLIIDETADGTWELYDSFQNNGIIIHSSTSGIELQYNGVTEMTIDGGGVTFNGTIDLSDANLNIGSADIVFGIDDTDTGARGLVWNFDADGNGTASNIGYIRSGGTLVGEKLQFNINVEGTITGSDSIYEFKNAGTDVVTIGANGSVTATTFIGALQGNADTATNADNADNADTVDNKHATDFNLQYVTDNGDSTTNPIDITSSSDTFTALTLATTGTSYVKQDFITDTIAGSTAYLIAYGSENAQDGSFAIKNNANHTTTNDTAGDIWFAANSAERLRIHGDTGQVTINQDLIVYDKVAIGQTASASQALHVDGNIIVGGQNHGFIHGGGRVALSADGDIIFVTDANDTAGETPDGKIIFGGGSLVDTNADQSFTFADAFGDGVPRNEWARLVEGRFGIGETNPATKIHIKEEGIAPVLLTLHNTQVSGDILNDGTTGNFIDFKSTDANVNFTPQVRIGMVVQDYDDDNGVISEGVGNFVVYTGQGTDSFGNGTLTETFRVREDNGIQVNGTTNNLILGEIADGTWHLRDTLQDNGIKIYSSTGGMEFQYNGVTEMTIDGGGVSFTGTVDLSDANLNIGSADIVFAIDDTDTGARGLVWNFDADGNGTASNIGYIRAGGTLVGEVLQFNMNAEGTVTGSDSIYEFKNGGTDVFTIGADGSLYITGNVGIKQPTPASTLDVNGQITSKDIVIDFNTGTLSHGLLFRGVSGSAGDVGIRANGEAFEIYEPEQSNKVWLSIADDPQGNGIAAQLNSPDGFTPILTNYNKGSYINKTYIDGLNVDADTLDGISSASFLRSDTADTFTGGTLTISATAPILDFVDTNSFTDANDRFRIRAAGDVGQIRWYDSSESTDTVLTTFYPDGDVGIAKHLTTGGDITVNGGGVTIVEDAGNRPKLTFQETPGTDSFILEYNGVGSGAGNYVSFYSTATGWAGLGQGFNYIPQNGRVGIGEISPDSILHLSSSEGNTVLTIEADTDNNNEDDNPQIHFLTDGGLRTGAISAGNATYESNANTNSLNFQGNTLRFHTATTQDFDLAEERMRIDGDGRVGIGTDSPTQKLDVIGVGRFVGSGSSQIRIETSNSSSYRLDLIANYSYANPVSLEGYAGYAFLKTIDGGNAVALYTLNNPRLFINSSGNVGIGTTSPQNNLHIEGDAPTLRLSDSNSSSTSTVSSTIQFWDRNNTARAGYLGYPTTTNPDFAIKNEISNGDVWIAAGDVERMRITSAGNVGIGTTSPDDGVHIYGAGNGKGLKIEATSGNYESAVLKLYPKSPNADERNWSIAAYKDSSDDLSFSSSNVKGGDPYSSGTTRMLIEGITGNVGIGTTSPDRNLHVKGSTFGAAHIEGTTGDAFLEFTTANNNAFIGVDDSLNVLKINNTNTLGAAVHLAVRDNGWLGIGTDNPQDMLHLKSTGDVQIRLEADTDNVGEDDNPSILLVQDGGAVSGRLNLSGTNNLQLINQYDGAVEIGQNNTPNFTIDNTGKFAFGSALSTASHFMQLYEDTPWICITNTAETLHGIRFEDAQATSTQNALFGYNCSTNHVELHINNTKRFQFNSDGNFHADNDITAFSTSVSDARLKDDIETIDNALDKVKALRGVQYVWNKGSRKGQKDLGVVAQEVEKVLPEIVREKEMPLLDDSGEKYKTVDYEKMVGVLIEAMKEQQKQIDELKARLDGVTH